MYKGANLSRTASAVAAIAILTTFPFSTSYATLSSVPMPATASQTEPESVQAAAEQFSLASKLLSKPSNPDELKSGVIWMEKAANQAYAPALFELANFYENGVHVKQDVSKAAKLYEQAAQQGHVDAQFNLGVLYLQAPADFKKARYWLEKAAQQKDAAAQYNLALIYETPESGFTKAQEATHWFTQSEKKGNKDAHLDWGVR